MNDRVTGSNNGAGSTVDALTHNGSGNLDAGACASEKIGAPHAFQTYCQKSKTGTARRCAPSAFADANGGFDGGRRRVGPTIQLSNRFVNDLMDLFSLEPVLPVEGVSPHSQV
jgi:hypothetical protein